MTKITKEQMEKSHNLANYFDSKRDAMATLIPNPEKFIRILKNAILSNVWLTDCDKLSIFTECQKCAADGLVPDGREAALVKHGDSVVYIPMIRGLRKLFSESPQIAGWHCDLVYRHEFDSGRFEYQSGSNPQIRHEPIIVGDRGAVVAAYSIVHMADGQTSLEVMTRGQLDDVKKFATRNKKNATAGPWADHTNEMFRKTVVRRHFKSLPIEGRAAAAVERLDGLYQKTIDGELSPEPVRSGRPGAAETLKQVAAAEPAPPAEPVEVIEPEPSPRPEPASSQPAAAEARAEMPPDVVDVY